MTNTDHKTRLFTAIGMADLLERHYDDLPEDDRKNMTLEMCFAVRELRTFRNIISAMADLEKPADKAALDHISQ